MTKQKIKNLFIIFKQLFNNFFFKFIEYFSSKISLFLEWVNRPLQPLYRYLESEECIKKQDDFIHKLFNIWIPRAFFHNYIMGFFLTVIIANVIFGWWVASDFATQIILFLQFLYKNNNFNFFEVIVPVLFLVFYFIPRITPSFDVRVGAFLVSTGLFFLILIKIAAFDVNETFEVCSNAIVGKEYAESYPILFFAVDGLSLAFALLVTFIFPIVILTAWDRVVVKSNFFLF